MEFYDFNSVDDDLVILNGDFQIAESEQNHIKDILIASQGNYRQWPLIGMGINRFVNASIDTRELVQKIKIALLSDNFRVDKVSIDNYYKITIDAKKIR